MVIIFIYGLLISPDVRAIVKTGGNPITPQTVRMRSATGTGNERLESSFCLSGETGAFFSLAREIKLLLGPGDNVAHPSAGW